MHLSEFRNRVLQQSYALTFRIGDSRAFNNSRAQSGQRPVLLLSTHILTRHLRLYANQKSKKKTKSGRALVGRLGDPSSAIHMLTNQCNVVYWIAFMMRAQLKCLYGGFSCD